jgi:hypothetical protein
MLGNLWDQKSMVKPRINKSYKHSTNIPTEEWIKYYFVCQNIPKWLEPLWLYIVQLQVLENLQWAYHKFQEWMVCLEQNDGTWHITHSMYPIFKSRSTNSNI